METFNIHAPSRPRAAVVAEGDDAIEMEAGDILRP